MPELPEVETIKRTLSELVVGKEIADVTVAYPKIVKMPDDIEAFRQQLRGTKIRKISRRGKFLKIHCSPWILVSHLRMEGKYRLFSQSEPVEKHTHVIFHFTDGTELRYKDVRKFGTMHLLVEGEEEQVQPLKKLGPEPLSDQFTLSWFQDELSKRPTKIKALLLNQSFLVGLGNIYVDEALFQAKVHPERPASSLQSDEIKKLYQAIRKTLSQAIEAGGSSIRSYLNGVGEMGMFQMQLKVYGRKGEPCLNCGHPLTRLVVAGRGTHICRQCQK